MLGRRRRRPANITLNQHWFNVSCLLGCVNGSISPMQNQKEVTAYYTTEQLMHFGRADLMAYSDNI